LVSPDWEETVGKTSRQPKKWIEDMKEDVDTEKYILRKPSLLCTPESNGRERGRTSSICFLSISLVSPDWEEETRKTTEEMDRKHNGNTDTRNTYFEEVMAIVHDRVK